MYIFSIALIVMSNVLYNVCQKLTPQKVNPFITLTVTYSTAAIIALSAFFISRTNKSFVQSLHDINWTSMALGASLVGLEFGYIMAYRSGWNISNGSLVANILLAIALIPVGVIFFKEGFESNKIIGTILCIIGLIFINK